MKNNNSLVSAYQARLKRRAAEHPELYPQQYNKAVVSANDNNSSNLAKLIESVNGQPFYRWDLDIDTHRQMYEQGTCSCFTCVIGWLQKHGKPLPMFDYEQMLVDCIEDESKYILVRKSTGLGLTSLWLRYWVWRALKSDELSGKEIAIIVGPNIQLAIDLITKIRQLFSPHGISFDSRATTVTINNCTFTAYPSNHLDAMRSRMDLKVIIVDELEYFEPKERSILRDVTERYLAKTDPSSF
jgi:hypothetical protein